ncbi:PREDICTED: uncharacterized protein LOC105564025 isoform X2 [Vollenhovia emeryi]|uniref:uncharacterized protein LOC105564025 isoform X2 n=1 Tax=Vollenhovia emeryi TaxID=411798 RepID=UPI0005F57274|nr:PREDICTED: uncharacterized protein LOC105564025 isoform X2 [Vollenhovia emeryi]
MDVEGDGFCKPGSTEGRKLRLRRNDKESIDNKAALFGNRNNENNKNDTASTSQSPCDDDSILNFKSPKKICSVQSKVSSNILRDKAKKKAPHCKPKIINNERKSKSKNSLQNKKIPRGVQQPLIESSFFKSEKKEVESPQSSTDVKTAYVCPLCLKSFKDENSQTVHTKSCATKNNVSTKKLMDAVQLQERQASERKLLGLLSAPLLQDKKPAARKPGSCNDPDLQLALALSKSLYEKEEVEEWDEAQIMAMSSNSSVPDNNVECPQKATLQSFGFSRNTLPTDNLPTKKTKKRKLTEPTILQRRTAVERERILTERIAEILMGCEDFTQRSQEKTEESNKEKLVLKSKLLQQLHKIEEQNLMKRMEMDGRSIKNDRSLDNEQMQEMEEIQTVEMKDNDEALTIPPNTVNMCCKEKKFLDNLVISWRNILNDSSASDIIVFVKNGRYIWTHKLVFYTRCTNILLDVVSNDTEFSTAKEKICWHDTDYDVALAFLEFVYCGIIDRYSKILDSETSLSGVRVLGRKYKVHDLFTYLRQKECKPNVAEVKHDYTCEKDTEIGHLNVERTLNIPNLGKSPNGSPNRTHDIVGNIQCPRETLLQADVKDDSLENDYTLAKNLCLLQDEKSALMSDEINSRSNTPTRSEASASPDLFDDTPVTIHSDKSTVQSKDLDDSNIHILLNLIKQDADNDICSQKSLKTQDAEYSKFDKDVPSCSKNVMEIDAESESNSLKFSTDDLYKDSLVDTPQSKSKYIQDRSSEIIKQKSNLTLFIEKVQKENAKLDTVLNSNVECLAQTSSIRQINPFHVDKHDGFDRLPYDNVKQSVDTKERPGRLTMIEQHMRSFADKNPEFYSRLSNEQVRGVKQTNSSPTHSLSSKEIVKSSYNNVLNGTQSFTSPDKKHMSIMKQDTTVPAECSQHSETMKQSLSETFLDMETNEGEISMYSKYMRDHKDNSIAKYRSAISRNKSDSNLYHKSTSSDSINKDNNISEDEKDKILAQSVLTQKDADIILSSDTDVESISSNVSHIVSENDDSDHEDTMSHSLKQSRKRTEDSKVDVENENSNRLLEVEKFSKAMTKEGKNINSPTKSNQDKLNTTEITSMTQKSGLNDDEKQESVPSPIMVSSSPDFSKDESCSPVLNMGSSSQNEHCTEDVSETTTHQLRKSVDVSFNFEDDIYLANVDIDKYEKPHVLEKSLSFNTLSTAELKNSNARNTKNKNRESIKGKDVAADYRGNLDNNVTVLTQNFTSIKKFQRKSLSEGQINTNRLSNQGATSTSVALQFQCNYVHNIGNAQTPKVTDKDVTPPPDYNNMGTPELHREMKKYGLKVQKRNRAVKLLTHIYNELHPLVPEKMVGQQITEISSDEDEGPPTKKRNVNDNSLEKSSDAEDSDNELPCSQDSNDSVSSAKETINKEMQFYETASSATLENSPGSPHSSDITEAFMRLINIDKDLHNKILQYEPVDIEQLRSTLKTHGFKCKLSNLMSFLDQQCITFYTSEQSAKGRTRRKT